QQLSIIQEAYSIKFFISQTSTKGKSTAEEYYFNLADINPSSVRFQTVKDIIRISIRTKNNQRFIKKIVDGKLDSYTNQIDMAADNADNAREIQSLFKEAIPLAQEAIKSDLNLSDWSAGVSFLKTNLVKAEIGETSYQYGIAFDQVVEPRMTLEIKQSGGKNPADEIFRFNLADLNKKKVSVGVTGTTPYVSLETQGKLKYIYVSKNGEQQSYTNTLKIPCSEVDEARRWVAVFEYLVQEAPERNKDWMPEITGGEQALQIISQLVTDTEVGNTQYKQTIAASCPTTFSQNYNQKESSIDQVAVFNWADLDPKKCKITVSGASLYINLASRNNQKIIQISQNGEIKEFARSTKIMLPYVETGRALEAAIREAIPFCEEATKNLVGSWSDQERLEWLKTNVTSVSFRGGDLDQSWDQMDPSDPCSFRLEQTQSGKNTTTETIEFFGKDLDAKGIKFEASGKDMGLRVSTKNRKKLIKVIEEGEEQPYVSSILIIFDTIEKTRMAQAILVAYAEACN
ncbi:MAG: hypothetical protein AAGH79_17100, partial [Bacteroidota bacterium]